MKEHFQAALVQSDPDVTPDPSEKRVLHGYCNLVEQIGSSSHTLGKDGKFQLFICLCARCVPPPLFIYFSIGAAAQRGPWPPQF